MTYGINNDCRCVRCGEPVKPGKPIVCTSCIKKGASK